jgi:hypothetical protein
MTAPAISPALVWGVRRYLAAPRAEIRHIRRQPFPGGLSGSQLEYWHLALRQAGMTGALTLVYKRGKVVAGAFLQGAPQREALAYASLPGRIPLDLPTVVAVSAPTGEIWMLPFPPAKPATHWQAAWDESDVREVIADLARLHAAFWNRTDTPATWPWLLQPTLADATRLVNEGREGLEQLQAQARFDASLTPERADRLLALARDPAPLLEALNAGPKTLLHGDAGFQNIAITRDGVSRIWFDWQLVGWGPPALDWVTFLHPWAYPDASPPLGLDAMTDLYLRELARRGIQLDPNAFQHQLDAALLWRWLIQWAPLWGTYRERLRPQVKARLDHAFARLHWPALDRWSSQSSPSH